jgi:subfamily B ATP-binding cassette protein MsbA
MKVFKRLLKLAKPYRNKFIIAMLCMLVIGAMTSALAFLVKPALDDIFLKPKYFTLI